MNEPSLFKQMQKAGCHPYEDPETLDLETIDPVIREAVSQINQSGWLWTGESCQGHPDADHGYVWAGNTEPYLRLIFRTEDEGRFGSALLQAAHHSRQEATDAVLNDSLATASLYSPAWRMGLHSRETGWTCVYLYVTASTTWERDMGCRFLALLGRCARTLAPTPEQENE